MCFHTGGQCEYWRQCSVSEYRQVGRCRWSVVQCRHLHLQAHPVVVVADDDDDDDDDVDDVDRCFTDNAVATDTSFSQRFSFLINI